MGKRIIVRGADFSSNGIDNTPITPVTEIVWYEEHNTITTNGIGAGNNTNATTYAGRILSSSTLGQPINYIRCNMPNNNNRPAVGSSFAVAVFSLGDAVSSITPIKTFTITSEDRTNMYVFVRLDEPVTIESASTTLGIGLVSGTGYMPVSYQSGGTCLRGTSWNQTTIAEQSFDLAISYGYISGD